MTRSRSAAGPSTLPPPATGLTRRWRKVRLGVSRRLRPFDPIVVPFDVGLKIAVRPGDRLGRAICLKGYSDRDHAALLHAYLRPGMTYFDVGAHVGQFTLIAAARVGPTGQVHCFEATADTHQQLAANVALNGLDWVRVNRTAVYSEPGELELQVCVRGKGEFNAIGRPLRPEDEVVGTERVPATTIDAYCAASGVDRIDLMKIDTNGAELHVLDGAQRTLARADAPAIVCEFNDVTTAALGYACTELAARFRELGYELYRLDDTRRRLVPEPAARTYPRTVDVLAVKDRPGFEARLSDAAR